MSDKQTIILVADIENWAFDNIAQYLKKILCNKYEIYILYTEHYTNPAEFLKNLTNFSKIDFIHFFYRGYLKRLIEYIANNQINDKLTEKFLNAAIVTSIPDHLFIDSSQDILSYKNTFLFVDNYYTISEILHDIYSHICSYPKPWQTVIYDNVTMANQPNFDDHEKLNISWIGNSAWGEWHFGKDSDIKGYNKIIRPTLDLLQKEIAVNLNIADGANQKRSRQEIAEILLKTDILLIASSIEGTPLPLIEAMASGCAIISSNVGIVAEILPKIQRAFILPHDCKEFLSAIKILNSDRNLLKKIKRQNYANYKRIFLGDNIFRQKWIKLIGSSIVKAQARVSIKKQILQKIHNSLSKKALLLMKIENTALSNKYIKNFIKFILKFRLINLIARSFYSLMNK